MEGESTRDALVRALASDPGASIRELTGMVGLHSYGSTYAHIKNLIAQGRVIQTRTTGARRWRVAEEAQQ